MVLISHTPVRLLSRSNKWLFNHLSHFTWRQAMQSSLPSWTCRDPFARKIQLPGTAEFPPHLLHIPVVRMAHLQTHNQIQSFRRMLCINSCNNISAEVLSGKRPHPILTMLLFSSVAQSFPASLLLTLRYPTWADTVQLQKDGWNQSTQPYSWRPSALWT